MNHYSFVATDTIDTAFLNELELRYETQETVVLESHSELETLLKLLGSSLSKKIPSEINDVKEGWFLSGSITEFSKEEFDEFYDVWLKQTKRDNDMDEYGQLLFLNSLSSKLNKSKYKLVLNEKI